MTLWRRAGGLRGVGLVVLLMASLRLFQLLLVGWLVPADESIVDRLLIWDGGWFINVATDGYPDGYSYDEDGVRVGNGFAFFPLFPLLVRGVAAIGIPAATASLLVAGLAGIAAGVLIYLLGTALWSRRVGLVLTVLVCAQPMAVVLVMGYTEPLFLALVAGTLLAAHQRIWWLAGLLGVAAALTRPTGMAVGVALAVAVFMLWRVRLAAERRVPPSPFPARARADSPAVQANALQTPTPAGGIPLLSSGQSRLGAGLSSADDGAPLPGMERGLLELAASRTGSAPARRVLGGRATLFASKGPVTKVELAWAMVAAAVTLLAGPAFLAWVGWRVGEWDAWFKVQTDGWGSTFDGGWSVVDFVLETLNGGSGMVELVTAWMIIGTIVLCLLAIMDRVWPPLLVYGLIGLVLVVGQAGYWHSKPRLLVPVLLLACVPLAKGLAQTPARTAAAVLALWSAFGLWFGAYMITIWPFTI
ncbi:MAG TPA: hypothetical protein DGT23_14275 [Micromonosporaceae bacterium]|nr:hypothetical protein [Micromonosporaceae bacterium]